MRRAKRTIGLKKFSTVKKFALAVFVLLFSQILIHPVRVGADPAATLQCAKLTLSGLAPYRDYLVPQTPMQIYLALCPVALGQLVHLDPIFCFNIMTLVLAIFSFWLTGQVVRQSKYPAAADVVTPLAIAFAGINLMLLFEFGQAQHLFLLFTIPYFVSRWLRSTGHAPPRNLAIGTGIMAGLGANLALFYLPFLLLWEIFFLIWHRRLSLFKSPEFLAALGFSLLYVAHIFVLPADIRQPLMKYFLPQHWGPFIFDLRLKYAANGVVRKELIYSFSLICMISAWLGSNLRRFAREKPLAPLAILNVGGFSLFALLEQGLSAHGIVFMFAGLAIANLSIFALKLWGSKHPKSLHTGLAIAFTIFCCREAFEQIGKDINDMATGQFEYYQTDYAPMYDILYNHSGPDDPVLFLSTHEYPAFPAILQMRRRPVTCFLCGQPLVMLHRLDSEPVAMIRFFGLIPNLDRRLLLSRLKEEILSLKPKLIFVQGEDLRNQIKESGIEDILATRYLCFAVKDVHYYDNIGINRQHKPEYAGYEEPIDCFQLRQRFIEKTKEKDKQ